MAPVVTAPPGVEPIPGSQGGLGIGDIDVLDGFRYGLGSSFYYDSNIFQGSGGLLSPIVDDVVYSISPFIAVFN